MTDDADKIAADALESKANSLITERAKLRLQMAKDAAKDVEISRNISGCIAGANALGYKLELQGVPPHGTEVPQELKAFITARNSLWQLLPYFVKLTPPELIDLPGSSAAPTSSTPAPMPRVADVILDRLRAAANSGAKAVDIRSFISQTYHVEIHEKTVGMTLYRLQKDGHVRRKGHTWFLASSEAKNPGDGAPGAINSLDQKE